MSRRAKAIEPSEPFLETLCLVRVRFQEVDSLRVTWHGHYLTYFEEGRNAFGRQYGFGYQDILAAGLIAPLVHVELDYLAPSHFDELLEVRTRLHLVPGARLVFSYRVQGKDATLKVKGQTVQVFTDTKGELLLCRPAFYEAFLERWKGNVQAV